MYGSIYIAQAEKSFGCRKTFLYLCFSETKDSQPGNDAISAARGKGHLPARYMPPYYFYLSNIISHWHNIWPD
jgi:hypothetical protein